MDSGTEIIVAVIGSVTTITAAVISVAANRRPEPRSAPATDPRPVAAADPRLAPGSAPSVPYPPQPAPGYRPVYPQQAQPQPQVVYPQVVYPVPGGYQPQPVGVRPAGVQPVGAGGAVVRVFGALIALLLSLCAFFLIADFLYIATTEPDDVHGEGILVVVVAVLGMLAMLNLARVLIRRVGRASWRRPLAVSILLASYGLTLLFFMLDIQQS